MNNPQFAFEIEIMEDLHFKFISQQWFYILLCYKLLSNFAAAILFIKTYL